MINAISHATNATNAISQHAISLRERERGDLGERGRRRRWHGGRMGLACWLCLLLFSFSFSSSFSSSFF
jgi:hypothetical protein